MAELIDAYNLLLDDDLVGRVGESRVALACEMYTIEELRVGRFYDLHSMRIVYGGESDDDRNIKESQMTFGAAKMHLLTISP